MKKELEKGAKPSVSGEEKEGNTLKPQRGKM